MSVAPTSAKQSATPARLGSLGTTRKSNAVRPTSGSLLQRPTEASVALSHGASGSVGLGKGGAKPRKELSFKQQLLKKTIKESVMRPSGVMALHIKHGHFHDIDAGGMSIDGCVVLQPKSFDQADPEKEVGGTNLGME